MVLSIIVMSLFIETIVGALKPIWKADGEVMSVTEIVSICVGILIAVMTKMDMVSFLCDYSISDMPQGG